jgi:cell filamentation protein
MIQVQSNKLVSRTNDSAELVMLHKHLFCDIYDWAGQIRTIDMTRDGGEFFAPHSTIELNLSHVFSNLHRTNDLKGLTFDEFTHELARFYDDLNYIHPFRDGNGRTQRLFWSRVSVDAGWVLDWREVYGESLNEASRAAREARECRVWKPCYGIACRKHNREIGRFLLFYFCREPIRGCYR